MPTIQEALTQARAAVESPPEPVAVESAPAPVVEEVKEPVQTEETLPVKEDKTGRLHGPGGKFHPKTEKKPEAAKDGVSEAAKTAGAPPEGTGVVAEPSASPAPAPTPDLPPLKAPQSLKPSAREAFAKAPRELQEDVVRVDREVHRVMQESAQARKIAEQVNETLRPYEPLARANGMEPMQYAGSVLQTAAMLQMGAPTQRAGIIAQLINMYGVDLEAINGHLSGQAPAAQRQAAPPAPPVDINAQVEKALESRIALSQAKAFVDSAPEFLDDVKDDMLAIIESARARGDRNMTYQRAYTLACKLNENVSSVLEQREAAKRAGTATAATQQSKQAAVSVKSTPAMAPEGAPKGIAGAIAAARAKHGM